MLELARSFAVAWLLAMFGGAASGQAFWIVDKLNRPGTHFTDIPPAVAASGSGDIILVRYTDSTLYANIYQAPTVAREVVILGQRLARTAPGALDVPRLRGILTVNGIAADKRVVIANLALDDLTHTPAGVNCTGNAGQLHFVNCRIDGGLPMSVRFTDCARVRLRDCWIWPLAGGTVATRSDLVLEGCRLQSGYCIDPLTSTNLPGMPGLGLVSSTALLVRSELLGCGGYWNSVWCNILGNPAVPAAVVDSNSRLVAGPGSRMTGATHFIGSVCYTSSVDVAVLNQGALVLDPGCSIAGPITGPFVTQPQWQTRSSLAPVGGILTSAITAPPNTLAILASSLQPQTPTPTPLGMLGSTRSRCWCCALASPTPVARSRIRCRSAPGSRSGRCWRSRRR